MSTWAASRDPTWLCSGPHRGLCSLCWAPSAWAHDSLPPPARSEQTHWHTPQLLQGQQDRGEAQRGDTELLSQNQASKEDIHQNAGPPRPLIPLAFLTLHLALLPGTLSLWLTTCLKATLSS
jgi:hypothetical protein